MEIELQNMSDKPRRGRPVSGRKVVLQVPVDADDAEAIRVYAELTGEAVAEVVRSLITGDLTLRAIKAKRA